MDYQMNYTHEPEEGELITLVVEFSYVNDEGFCIDAVYRQGDKEAFEGYDEEDVLEKAEEYAEECAQSDAEDRAVSAWESKQYHQEQMYL
jgi:hypothetical protein